MVKTVWAVSPVLVLIGLLNLLYNTHIFMPDSKIFANGRRVKCASQNKGVKCIVRSLEV